MNRRVDRNHALACTARLANDLDLPLLDYGGLTGSYPLANDRHHAFILEGGPETVRRLGCFGLHGRSWQERPIFGTIRYMPFEGMRRKKRVDAHVREIEHIGRTRKDPFCLE